MPHFDKHFTLSEANALVPWVRSAFHKVHQVLREIIADRAKGGGGEPPWRMRAISNGSGNGRRTRSAAGATATQAQVVEMDRVWADLSTGEKGELINGLLGSLQEEGIVIQDVHRGLIDFPGWHGDDEILLCYELRDGKAIGYWHDLQAGYAGRLPIDDLIRQ
jgi:hypothetical protein